MASVQSHFWWLVRKSGFRHKVSLRPRARGSRGPWGQAWSSCFHTRGVAACARPTGRTRHRRISATFAAPVPRWSPAATPPPACPSRARLLALQGVRLGLASCPGGRWCCWPRARVLVWHRQAPPPLCPEPVLAVGDSASPRGRGTPARCQEGPRPQQKLSGFTAPRLPRGAEKGGEHLALRGLHVGGSLGGAVPSPEASRPAVSPCDVHLVWSRAAGPTCCHLDDSPFPALRWR